MSNKRQMEECYGFIHIGKKGCRFLSEAPSFSICQRCSFYKTKDEYYNAQADAIRYLNNKGLITVTTEDNIVTVINIYRKEDK